MLSPPLDLDHTAALASGTWAELTRPVLSLGLKTYGMFLLIVLYSRHHHRKMVSFSPRMSTCRADLDPTHTRSQAQLDPSFEIKPPAKPRLHHGPHRHTSSPLQPTLMQIRSKYLLLYSPELLWFVILWVLQHDYGL